MPGWGLLVERNLGLDGRRRVWSAGVMGHVDGTREETLEALRQRAEGYEPEHPAGPKRRRLYRERDGFRAGAGRGPAGDAGRGGRADESEAAARSVVAAGDGPGVGRRVQQRFRALLGELGGQHGEGVERGALGLVAPRARARRLEAGAGVTGVGAGSRPGGRRPGGLARRPAGALRPDQRPGGGAGAERVGGGGGPGRARGPRARGGAGAPHRGVRTRAGRPPCGPCGGRNAAGGGAIWTHDQPSAAVSAAYEADPQLAALRLDFTATPREMVQVLLARG